MNDYDATALKHAEIAARISECVSCPLSDGALAVPGQGAPDADVMFIGEAPGYNEDRLGVPFVGRAGEVLNEMLASIGLSRKDVYITNMVKHRPPKNRDPHPEELAACAGYLDAQIEAIAPKVIVALGRFSFQKFFPRETISKSRGKPRGWNGIAIFPMYHPAAALYSPRLRPAMMDDFGRLPALIESVAERQSDNGAQERRAVRPKQLGLFG